MVLVLRDLLTIFNSFDMELSLLHWVFESVEMPDIYVVGLFLERRLALSERRSIALSEWGSTLSSGLILTQILSFTHLMCSILSNGRWCVNIFIALIRCSLLLLSLQRLPTFVLLTITKCRCSRRPNSLRKQINL